MSYSSLQIEFKKAKNYLLYPTRIKSDKQQPENLQNAPHWRLDCFKCLTATYMQMSQRDRQRKDQI